MSRLIVKKDIRIQAPASRVWEVLVQPRYIRQWDDLPDDYDYRNALHMGSEINWEQPGGRSTKLTVIRLEQHHVLSLSLYVSGWEHPPSPEEVAYTYRLSGYDGHTQLTLEVGDFAKLPDGKAYYEASLEFAGIAVNKIKELAESKTA